MSLNTLSSSGTRLRLGAEEKELLTENLRSVIKGLRTQLTGYKTKEQKLIDLQTTMEPELKAGKVWVEKSVDGLPELCLTVGSCLRIENRLIGERPTFIILCPAVEPAFRAKIQDQVSNYTGRTLDNQVSATEYALLQLYRYLQTAAPGHCLNCLATR
jgi:hypothetical protein